MAGPLALSLPILLCILNGITFNIPGKRALRVALCLIVSFVLYGNAFQTAIDQMAMLEGRNATVTLTNELLHSMNDLGYLDAETTVCMVGPPARNPLFWTDPPFRRANWYAQFGDWGQGTASSIRAWRGVFNGLQGIAIKLCDEEECATLLASDEVQAMPVYPAEGSIAKMENGIVVVKVSDVSE